MRCCVSFDFFRATHQCEMCTHTRCAHAFGSMRKLCVYTYECIVLYVLAVCQLTQCIEAHVIATWIFMRMRALFRLLSPVCADTQPHTATKYVRIIHARAHTHKKNTPRRKRESNERTCVWLLFWCARSHAWFSGGWAHGNMRALVINYFISAAKV